MPIKTLIVLLYTFSFLSNICLAENSFLKSQLHSTLNGLELMRSPNGIIQDLFEINFTSESSVEMRSLNTLTSPTNIGLDLLIQLELAKPNDFSSTPPKVAVERIERILRGLGHIQRDPETGLFYNWFDPITGFTPLFQRNYLSSIDNFHLAFALWVIKENFSRTEAIYQLASDLFDSMDFSTFYDPKTKFIAGVLLKNQDGQWSGEGGFPYSYLGSEARSLYGIGEAIGIYKHLKDSDFPENAVPNLAMEVARSPEINFCLRTWDGGAFQLLLPEILASEHLYSKALKTSFYNYSHYIVEQAEVKNLPLPAAFSASSQASTDQNEFGHLPIYNGGMGHLDLIAANNTESQIDFKRELWDLSATPHAAFLALYFNPDGIERYLQLASFVHDQTIGTNIRLLFSDQIGWMDGYIVRGPLKGKVVPIQLALDQEMIALSLIKTLKGGSGLSAETLLNNPSIKSKMMKFYQAIDARLGF